jgi:hypothetical protein
VSATRAITLPHGLLDGRRRRSTAELRLPTGADEASLLEARDRSRAEQVTGLLGRCVARVDELEADEDVTRSLTVGDREALLLHLRAGLFGDRLSCVIDCSECREAMDVDLLVSDLLVPPYDEVSERHTVELAGGRGKADVRLVTGADQEAAAHCGGGAAGLEELIARCVFDVRGGDGAVPPLVLAEAVSHSLAELDPQAEITIDAACPTCDEPISALVDAAGILLAELTAGDDRLLREVDAIARAYHWSEAEILALDVRRRRRYLELIVDDGEES